jgi:hypothetical protein
MTAPKRLIEAGTEFDRALLRASRQERPPADFERRVIAAARLGAPASAFVLPRASLAVRLSMAVAFVGLAAVGFVAVRASESPAILRRRSTIEVRKLPSIADTHAFASAADESDEVVAPDLSATNALVVTTPDALPTAPPAEAPKALAVRSLPAPAPIAADSSASEAASLQREVELLDRVKRDLRSGAVADAKRGLDGYDSEFPRGTLVQEAGLLRVRVLLAEGHRVEAATLGEQLLRRHPNGVFERRIRAALTNGTDKSAPSPSR